MVKRKSVSRKSPRKSVSRQKRSPCSIKRQKIGSGKEIRSSSSKVPGGYIFSGAETDLMTGKRDYFYQKWEGKYRESCKNAETPPGSGWKKFMTSTELSKDYGRKTNKALWIRTV